MEGPRSAWTPALSCPQVALRVARPLFSLHWPLSAAAGLRTFLERPGAGRPPPWAGRALTLAAQALPHRVSSDRDSVCLYTASLWPNHEKGAECGSRSWVRGAYPPLFLHEHLDTGEVGAEAIMFVRDQPKPQYPLYHIYFYLVGAQAGLRESSSARWITGSHHALSRPVWKRPIPQLSLINVSWKVKPWHQN